MREREGRHRQITPGCASYDRTTASQSRLLPCGSWPTVRRAVTVGLLIMPVAAPQAAAADSGKERDVHLVYCLDASHRAGLVEAAVRLSLLEPGATAEGTVEVTGKRAAPMTLTKWAELRKDAFGRACGALMAAESDAPGSAVPKEEDGWLTLLLKSLPLLAAGAVLTLGGQFSERISAERRQRRKQLESTGQAFRSAARLYLAAYERDPHAEHTEVLPAREALSGALAQVSGPAARSRAARRLADALPLAQRLPEARDGERLGTDTRRREAETVRQLTDRQLRQASDLNRLSPYWWWRALRDRSAGSGA